MSGSDKVCVVSTGALSRLMGAPYWDLRATLQAAQSLGNPPLELVLLPEWDSSGPPVTPHQADLSASQGMGPERVLALVVESGCTVASVHASRDVGLLLSSPRQDECERGKRQLQCAYTAAAALGAGQVVVHAWDTYGPKVSPERVAECLVAALGAATPRGIFLSIEGIPVSDPDWKPVRLAAAVARAVQRTQEPDEQIPRPAGVTVDLNWTSLAGDLEDCFELKPADSQTGIRLLNIHVQGSLTGISAASGGEHCGRGERGEVRPRDGSLDFGAAIRRLAAAFPKAQLTLELTGPWMLAQVRSALHWAQRLTPQVDPARPPR